MSYPWANNLLYRMAGSEPPAQNRPGGPPRGEMVFESGIYSRFYNINTAWTAAERLIPGWQIITLRQPPSYRSSLTFTIDTGNGGQPEKRSQFTMSRSTGE